VSCKDAKNNQRLSFSFSLYSISCHSILIVIPRNEESGYILRT
jgi:hypothetical protein